MIDEITNSVALHVEEVHRLVASLNERQMSLQPVEGMNHASWNIGHIVFSFQAMGGEMGVDQWLPAQWTDLFGQGSKPIADPERYPSKQQLLDALDDAKERITRRLNSMSVGELQAPLPDVRYRNLFPTLGHAVLHILAGHIAVHIGQIRAWRRAALLPAPEPEETSGKQSGPHTQ